MPNEYDELLSQEEGNEYDALLSEKENEPKARLRSSMLSAADTQPEQQAQVIDLAERTRLPVDVVGRNIPDVERKARQESNEYEQLLEKSPATAEWLSNPENAKLAHDDATELALFEDYIRPAVVGTSDFYRSIPGGAVELAGSGMQGAGQFVKETGRAAVTAYSDATDTFDPDATISALSGELPLLAQPLQETVTIPGYTGFEQFSRSLDPVDELVRVGEMVEEGGKVVMPPRERQGYHTDVGGALGQIASYAAAPPATLVAFFGSSYKSGAEKAKNEGATSEQQRAAGLLWGMTTLVSEKTGIDLLLKRIPPNIRNKVVRKATDIILGAGIEGTEEWVEDKLHQLVDKGVYDPDAEIDYSLGGQEASAATAAGITRIILGGLGVHARNRSTEQQVKQQIEQLTAIRDQAIKTKLFTRHKGKFEEFAQQAAEQGEDPNIYLSAKEGVTYFQEAGEDAQTTFEQLGVADQVPEALARGGDLVIPIGKFVATFGDTPHFDALINNVRINQGDMTLREFHTEKEATDSDMMAEADRIMSDLDQETPAQVVGQKVADMVAEQLTATERFTPDVVDQYASLWSAFASTAVSDGLITPEQVEQMFNISVVDQDQVTQLEHKFSPDQSFGDLTIESHYVVEETGETVKTVEKAQNIWNGTQDRYQKVLDVWECINV